MISVELWRARIGGFNRKNCSSEFLSSLFTQPRQYCTSSAAVVSSTLGLSNRSSGSTTGQTEKHLTATLSAEHGFYSAISIKQLRSSSLSLSSFSFSSSDRSRDSVFQYHSPQLKDVLIILLTVIAVISQLLIISGDIETNPGPKRGADEKPNLDDLLHMTYTGEDGKKGRLRLMEQVRPHWRILAIALKFPQHEIAALEHKDDPVYYLLSEWLRGANMKNDPRPVTWRTLVTALDDANIQDVATVLESHFIQIEIPKADCLELPNSRPITLFKGFVLIRNLSGGYTMRHGSVEVVIKPDVSSGLMSLVGEYADMLLVLRSTKLRNKSTKKLVTFFSDFSDEQLVRECSTLSKAIDILIEKFKIYIFNIDILKAGCKHFDKPQMRTCVQKYKQHLDEFLENTSVKEFMDNFQTKIVDHEIVEFVTLKLDESRIDCSLRALKTLICHFFGVIYKALGHCDTGAGCVCITWLVPSSLVPLLRMKAKQLSQEYLTSQGVLELVIGLRIAPSKLAEQQVRDQPISKQDENVTHEEALSANSTVIINLSGQNEQLQSRISELEEQLKMRDENFLAIHDKYELVERDQDTDLGVSFKHVIRELEQVTQWQKLGLIFGVPQQYLDMIYERHKDEPNKCTEMVITRWWDMYPGSTWKEVVAALCKIGETHLADFLKEKYVVLRADSDAYDEDSGVNSESEESAGSAAEDQLLSDSLQPMQRNELNPRTYQQTTRERSPLPGYPVFFSTQIGETPLPPSIAAFWPKKDLSHFEPGFTPKDLNHSEHEYQQTSVGETPEQTNLVLDQGFTSRDNLHFEPHESLQTHIGETFHTPISSPSYAEFRSRDNLDHFEHDHQHTHGETPDQMSSALYQVFSLREYLYRFKHVHQLRDIELLKADLTVENYKSRFHQLLCREEEEHEKILRDRCDGLYTLTMYHHGAEAPGDWRADENEDEQDIRFGYLSADDLDGDKVAYAEQACENQGNLVLSYNGEDYLAKMVLAKLWKKKKHDYIYIRMTKEDALKFRDNKSQFVIPDVHVMFELKYSYFDRLHEAVDLLSHCTIQRLIPVDASWFSCPDENPPLFLSNRYKEFLSLDHGQLKALQMIVYAEPKAPAIVVGSFGTGKTQVLAQAAFQILVAKYDKNPRVLICAHHQASANVFLTKYFGPMKELGWRVSIARMIMFGRVREIDERYRQYCKTSLYVAKNLSRIQLVVTTFANCLHLAKLLKGSADRWFTHILIDEGAQTREPETIAPLFMCGPKTVVAIAGDHKQVGPSMLVLGEDPLKYGLGQSLLERLHTLYSTQTHTNAENHCATLIHNYRCHLSLLALPSYLFYHSALIASRNASKQAILHPDTCYSLHFICSSLDDTIVEVQDSTNQDEAELLLEAAAKYVRKWPPEWGNRELKTVCVMATTANQQNLIRKTMMSTRSQQLNFVKCPTGHGQYHNSIEILKVYDMQGREFQCVFLSTAEPTTANGASKNPTKTPCSQYVFNTALTRAKSLVVCAGNPFLLMEIEKQMNNVDKRPFWAEYIRRCIENKTFIIPASLQESNTDRQDKLSKLRALVFKSGRNINLNPSPEKDLDSITGAYKKAFENLPNLQRCQVQLKYAMGGMQWQMNEKDGNWWERNPPSPTQKKELPIVLYCKLEFLSYHKALAHPIHPKQPVVILNGPGNRKGAFDGDIVAIELYDSNVESEKRFGKVIRVIQKCHQERHVCQVDCYSTIHFKSIDKKTPTFVNLPRISRDLLRYRKEDIMAGLKSQNQWVVVFEEDSLPLTGDNTLPKIKEVISAASAKHLLFVVKEIGWDRKYRLPLGAVVESLPLGTNFFNAEKLLRAAYSVIKDDFDAVDDEEDEIEEISVPLPPGVVCQAFTIESDHFHNADYALSLVRESDDTYTMSVLIANVGGQLEQGSVYDTRACAFGNYIHNELDHSILPASICQKLGLSLTRICDVFVVAATVTVQQDGRVKVASDPVIKVGKVQLQVKLNHVEAQCLIDQDPSSFSSFLNQKYNQYPSSAGQPNLLQSLKLLYKMAVHLRVERLGQVAYAYNFIKEKPRESWQAYLLEDELMVWANAAVAKYVYQHMPRYAVLIRECRPPEEEKLLEKLSGVIGHSVALNGVRRISSLTDLDPFIIPHSILQEFHKAIENRDAVHLQQLLTSDYLYPQLAAASARLRAISQRAEYICSNNVHSSDTISPFHHHSLCLDHYTHFTSPTKCFCDVVMQRILLSILSNTECSYTVKQLENLCCHLNVRSQEAKLFQQEVNLLGFAQQFGESCEETLAYVHKNEDRYEVYSSEFNYQSCLKKSYCRTSALVCSEEEKDEFLKWKVFMFSFHGNDFILNNSKLSFSCEHSANALIEMAVFCSLEDTPALATCDSSKLSKGSNYQDKLNIHKLSSTLKECMVTVDASKWQSIISKIDNLSEDTMQQLSDDLPKLQVERLSAHSLATVKQFKASPVLKYEVKRKLDSNSIVPVWLGQSLLCEPIMTPCLQLMEVAPELRICLQHNKYPAECFSDPVLSQASKAVYTSLDEYVTLWEKVYVAEVAHSSVHYSKKPLIMLKDVPLQWPELKIPENSIDEYLVPGGPIILEIFPEKRYFLMYGIHIDVGDLVCVRYGVKEEQCKAVYHFVVSDVYEVEESSEEDFEDEESFEEDEESFEQDEESFEQNEESFEQYEELFEQYEESFEQDKESFEEGYQLSGTDFLKLFGENDELLIEEDEKLSEEENQLPLIIEMKPISRTSCRVSQKMVDALRQHQPTCEIQVINIQESHQNVYKSLVSLNKERHNMRADLVYLVTKGSVTAFNRKNGRVEEALRVFRTDPMAHLLWTNGFELNTIQKEAIQAALTNCFQMIQGPPGTGKSEIGAHIAYIFAQLLKGKQCVVYCAPSNKAVDVVHDKLCQANEKLRMLGHTELKLLRLYGRTCEKIDFPGPYTSHGYLAPAEGERMCHSRFKLYALHHLIRKNCPELMDIEKQFEEMHHQGNTVPTSKMLTSYKNLIEIMEQNVLDKCYDIILTTCSECAGHRLSHLKEKQRVAQVIVDECGMAHEPETIAAVSLSEHVVLIGDHKQLQPVVRLTAARENGLGTSLFQRYAENFAKTLIVLQSQYRMHAGICEFPSMHFYNSMLKPHSSVKMRPIVKALQDFWPAGLSWPIVFCDMVGEEEETPEMFEGQEYIKAAHSKCNHEEAKKAIEIAQVLRRNLQDEVTIAILTPYKAQKWVLDELQSDMVRPSATVHTINESQGDEYDYVILTTVRSQPLSEICNPDLVQPDRKWLRDTLGFVTDPHQVNVAITRAKQGLIIVGNHTLLEYDNETWSPLIQFYKENSCVVNASTFPC